MRFKTIKIDTCMRQEGRDYRGEAVTRLQELNEQRIKCQEWLHTLGMVNTAWLNPEERLAQSVRFHLAKDAWKRAEAVYQKALSETPTEQLIELAKG